jgi:heterodisulfide reductase subunit A
LIIGAGIGGVRAAFDLADSGYQVYLIDRSPAIGGTISQLDNQFPSNHCGMCRLLPTLAAEDAVQSCLRRELVHPRITIMTQTELIGLEGGPGEFRARVRRVRPLLEQSRCIGCGICAEVCPVQAPDPFNEGLTKRKAAFLRIPTAVPRLYTIDPETCTRCGLCVDRCPTRAIDLREGEEITELPVGAIILSPGFEEFEARAWGQYGHGRFANVVTSVEFERLFSGSGPGAGRVVRPSDGQIPRRVAFLQCVGSRDKERGYCSAACCMFALKEAMITRKIDPDIQAKVFYMDLRAFGKGYYRYHQEAATRYGVQFSRCRVSSVKEHPRTRNITVIARSDDGSYVEEEFDLAVLSIGLVPPPLSGDLAQVLGVSVDQYGFHRASGFSSVETNHPGVFVCGAFGGPKDIPETVTEAQAAALKASRMLKQPEQTDADEPRREEPETRTGIFLCGCGGEIGKGIDLGALHQYCGTLPHVTSVEVIPTLCLPEGLGSMQEVTTRDKLTRVVIAACAPYSYEVLFRRTLAESGISGSFLEMVDLREELLWVHGQECAGNTTKAKGMLGAAVAKVNTHTLPATRWEKVLPEALVIGGGLGGMTVAGGLAERGVTVHLVEQAAELGGNAREIPYLKDAKDPQGHLRTLVDRVQASDRIKIHLNAEVSGSSGYVGNFSSLIARSDGSGEPVQVSHAVTIVATGAQPCMPEEYGYGQSPRVLTQRELAQKLAGGEVEHRWIRSVVMIQCVGSRDEKHPYCSRICCTQAMTNALKIKGQNPDASIYILNRDIMTYGLTEESYTLARDQGVIFLRYESEQKPQVRLSGDELEVEVVDPILGSSLVLKPDLLVLSSGIVPGQSNRLARTLDIDLDPDGFFAEADSKFRPVDVQRDGIYVCGLAHSPRSMEETIAQAEAVTQRALSVLTRGRLVSRRIVAEVNERRCSACELCIAACVYDARVRDVDRNIVAVRDIVCQGCGACAMVCPNDAVKLRGLQDKQVMEMIDAVLK